MTTLSPEQTKKIKGKHREHEAKTKLIKRHTVGQTLVASLIGAGLLKEVLKGSGYYCLSDVNALVDELRKSREPRP